MEQLENNMFVSRFTENELELFTEALIKLAEIRNVKITNKSKSHKPDTELPLSADFEKITEIFYRKIVKCGLKILTLRNECSIMIPEDEYYQQPKIKIALLEYFENSENRKSWRFKILGEKRSMSIKVIISKRMVKAITRKRIDSILFDVRKYVRNCKMFLKKL